MTGTPGYDGRLNYTCPVCGYWSRDKTNLRKHMYIHTGEKPHSCTYCQYKTTNGSNLKRHIRTHHQEFLLPESDEISGFNQYTLNSELIQDAESF